MLLFQYCIFDIEQVENLEFNHDIYLFRVRTRVMEHYATMMYIVVDVFVWNKDLNEFKNE